MVALPGGVFDVGSPMDECGRASDEGPVHQVELRPFLISRYEVTQDEYQAVTGNNPSLSVGGYLPVENLS
jgi:formylglycine-generating enzyme required for sulfatase activity